MRAMLVGSKDSKIPNGFQGLRTSQSHRNWCQEEGQETQRSAEGWGALLQQRGVGEEISHQPFRSLHHFRSPEVASPPHRGEVGVKKVLPLALKKAPVWSLSPAAVT